MPVTLQTPFGVQCKPYGEARSAEFDGTDGTGRTGRDGTDGTVIKSVL